MFKLNHYSFGKRIGFGFAIIVLLLLMVYGESVRSRHLVDNNIIKLNAANVGVREMFGLQVLENTYLNTRDPIYAARFKKWHKFNLDNFIASKSVFDSPMNLPLVEIFEKENRAYGELFNEFNQQMLAIQAVMALLESIEADIFSQPLLPEEALLIDQLAREREHIGTSLASEDIITWQDQFMLTRTGVDAFDAALYQDELNNVGELLIASEQTRDAMMKAALKVRNSAKQIAKNVAIQMEGDKQFSSRVGLSVSIFAVFACVVIGFVIRRSVVKPIQSAIVLVEQLAKGELYHHIESDGRDEMASLVSALNRMSDSLHHMVSDINQNLTLLTSMTNSMSDISETNKEGTDQQLTEYEQLAAGMTEMSATMVEISNSVNEVSESVRESEQLIHSCNQVSTIATTDIKNLNEHIKDASDVVDGLAQEAENINTVLDVINSISEQTNLLALNAAIEAARAGEQGRGFAVVADEVRLLAQRTQSSTQEIHSIIESLRQGASHAVDAMRVSQDSVASSHVQVEEISQHIHRVSDLIQNVDNQTLSLSTAAEQQSMTAESFNQSLQVIVEVTRAATDVGQQLAGNAQQLSQCKDEIHEHMTEFQLTHSSL